MRRVNRMPDWNRRKGEIGTAFRNAPHLPAEADADAYAAILVLTGVTTNRDMSIIITIVQDAIMQARREERPTTPLDSFLDWLEQVRNGARVR